MSPWVKAAVAGGLAAGICLGAVAWTDARQISSRKSELSRETRVVAKLFATRIQGGLQKHLTVLEQMANFYSSSRKVTEKEFQSFAATTLSMSPSCLNVAFVERGFRVQRVFPAGARSSLLGLDVSAHPIGYETIARARRARGPVLSPPLQLIRGPRGFVLAVPVFNREGYMGTLVAACQSSEYFASTLLPELSERYQQMVLDSGEPIFANAADATSHPAGPPVAERFDLGGTEWEVRVWPRMEVVEGRLEAGRTAYWTLGLLLAAATGALAGAGSLWAAGMTDRLASERMALLETRSRLEGTRGQLRQAEKLTAVGELVAGVAHEINNPLAGILGYTQLLLQRRLSEGVRRRILTISAEAERMAKVVRNLLAFARKHAPEKRLHDLNKIIDKTLELKAYHLRASQIRILKDFAPDLPLTLLDFNQMQQVLINLLNNAQQALAEARRGGTITLSTRHADGLIELRVADDGPGIPAEAENRIFEPFFTTKKEGVGTGLGLSLCYGIIQEHGGSIRAQSGSGKGATFFIGLPVRREATEPPGPPAPDPPRRMAPLRILLVDDEPAFLSFLTESLSGMGHRVEAARDVPEALERITSGRYDLIITDLRMPGGTGVEIYRAAVEKAPRLARRVIFTTGQPTGDETARFMRDIEHEPLLKPFKIEDIERAIERAMRN